MGVARELIDRTSSRQQPIACSSPIFMSSADGRDGRMSMRSSVGSGRGLEALIGASQSSRHEPLPSFSASRFVDIRPNPFPTPTEFDPPHWPSWKRRSEPNGLLQPLTVVEKAIAMSSSPASAAFAPSEPRLEGCSRRSSATSTTKRSSCLRSSRISNDADLNPIEEARGYQRLSASFPSRIRRSRKRSARTGARSRTCSAYSPYPTRSRASWKLESSLPATPGARGTSRI